MDEQMIEENRELRKIIAELGYCVPDASLEFMRLIPAEVRAAHSVAGKVAELTDERDHLQRCLRVAYPYISDKAGAGILSAIDAALAPYPERR